MSNYQNHLVDPTYFFDAIEEFAFDYDMYVEKGKEVDERGRIKKSFMKTTIRGSLQSQGTTINRSKQGNYEEMQYNFYCKSLYRINIGDFIFYKNRWLIVNSVQDYDEWGCRSASLSMVNLNNYKDFMEWLKYQEGEVII